MNQKINYGTGSEYKFCNIEPIRSINEYGSGFDTPKRYGDSFESLIGAIFLDGGYEK